MSTMYNRQYNGNSETELVNMPHDGDIGHVKARPFDWFICAVLGYLCFPCTGICAIYYAVRANHAVDWGRDDALVLHHTKKAKCLTLTSIAIGVVLVIVSIIIIVVIVNQMMTAIHTISEGMSQMSNADRGNYY